MTFSSNNNLYGFPQPLTRVFPAPIIAQRAPTTADISYPIGQLWVDEAGDDYYGLVDVTAGVATWSVLAAQPGNIDTLTGDSGGAIAPVAGNIDILGGPGVSVAGTAGTLTINLTGGGVAIDSFAPDAGTNPVVPDATGLVTMAGTANQITTTGGLNSLTFSLPSAVTAPGSLTTTTSLTAGSGFTVSAGAVTVTTGTSAINISADAAATTINFATGAGVKTLTVGSTNSTSTTTIACGTGGVAVGTSANAHTSTFGSTTTTSTTVIQAGSGGITATGAITASSNVIINGAASQLRVHGGAVTDFIGQAVLVNGTVTVANTNIAATDRVFLGRSAVNASTALGVFKCVITAATNFVITACKPADGTTETGDASTVDYFIVRQV